LVSAQCSPPAAKTKNYFTADFSSNQSTYAHPAAADTGAPVLGPVTYSIGTAASPVSPTSPQNKNDKARMPQLWASPGVVFYTNQHRGSGKRRTPGGQVQHGARDTKPRPGNLDAPMTVNTGKCSTPSPFDGSRQLHDSRASGAPPIVNETG